MELQRPVVAFLTETGLMAMQAAGVPQASGAAYFYALETDEAGLWVSIRKDDGEHKLLVPWDCILTLDVPVGGTPFMETIVQGVGDA